MSAVTRATTRPRGHSGGAGIQPIHGLSLLEVRGRIFGAFELAELEEDSSRRAAFMTFVVIGAGPTGVEMASQIAELSRYSLRSNFRRIDSATARIVLVYASPRILRPRWRRRKRTYATPPAGSGSQKATIR